MTQPSAQKLRPAAGGPRSSDSDPIISSMSVAFFKKGKTRPASTRQRSPPQSAPADAAASELVLPSRKAAPRLLSQGTKRPRRDGDGDDPGRVDVNWAAGAASNANAALEILEGDEAEALLARKRARLDPDDDAPPPADDGLYKGQAAYRSHVTKSKDVPKAMRVGPQKSTSTIRTVTIVDYQPDVCKDYKETGFCGFGDTCKFLHDRGTYLAGWQLDKLAAEPAAGPASDSDEDAEIPFGCLICRKPYSDPVVTRCGHYFCSACAIKRFAKTPKCIACGAPTGGIFNRADKVIEKLRAKQAKDDAEAAEAAQGRTVEVEGPDSDGSDA